MRPRWAQAFTRWSPLPESPPDPPVPEDDFGDEDADWPAERPPALSVEHDRERGIWYATEGGATWWPSIEACDLIDAAGDGFLDRETLVERLARDPQFTGCWSGTP